MYELPDFAIWQNRHYFMKKKENTVYSPGVPSRGVGEPGVPL